MASSPSTLILHSFSQRFPPFTHSFKRIPIRIPSIKASSNEPESENDKIVQTESEKPSKPLPTTRPKKPIYSMKKGQIVSVDKEKYLDSINIFLYCEPHSQFECVEQIDPNSEIFSYVLNVFDNPSKKKIAWVGVPTAPAWLPTDMLIKSDRLDYERI
ncbi:NAD(P)H-quinone oxidoreductase subunit O, chloroplastic-like [Tasmannia lanceolata]|uniref:NAD(P)H-quinone oxidoreductase subunit O, chloroplastic-like n=1 Tax=Tasmannia lanceolata TaxID=3420 RepID=UPI004063A0C2